MYVYVYVCVCVFNPRRWHYFWVRRTQDSTNLLDIRYDDSDSRGDKIDKQLNMAFLSSMWAVSGNERASIFGNFIIGTGYRDLVDNMISANSAPVTTLSSEMGVSDKMFNVSLELNNNAKNNEF